MMRICSCEGGALPVIMSIIGPREPHDYSYRDYNLLVPGTFRNLIPKKSKVKKNFLKKAPFAPC